MNKFKPSFDLFFSDFEPQEKELAFFNNSKEMAGKWTPGKASIMNILAYSKSLSVKNTKALGTMFLNMN